MKNISRYLILAVFLAMIPFVYFSCKSSRTSASSLRIIQINNSEPLIVDGKDWFVVSVDTSADPWDSTFEFITYDWIVPIEVGYVEEGLGLPTYPTSYTARCTSYTVIFRRIDRSSPWRPLNVTGATNIVIPTSPTATKTANLKLIPVEWINMYLDTIAPTGEDEPEVAPGCMVKATVVLQGYEELTHNPIADTGFFTIDFGDYWDNPALMGNK